MDSIRLQTAAIDHLKPRRFGRSRAAAAAVLSALVACAPMIVQAAHAVSGRVADDQGAGIDGVEVRFYTEDSLNCLAPVATCVTQSDGAYTCPVEAGEYYLAAFPPVESLFAFEFYPDTYPMRSDFAPTTVAADLAGLDFALEQGGRVRLQLLTEAGEIPPFQLYVHVRFQNERGGTWWDDRRYDGQTGQYYSEVFPAGDYILLLTHAGQAADYVDPQYYCGAAAEERATNVTISRGSTIDLGECRLISAEPNGAIAGTVQGADAAPLAGIPVVAYQAEWHVIASTETDQNGAFELEVPRNGEYKIAAEPGPPSFHTRAYYPGFSLFSEGDWVEEGRTDIHFQLGVGGRVRFTLTGEAGSALGFACPVSIFDREQGSTPVVAEGRSDSSGIFISPTLPGGSYSFVLGPPAGSGYLPTQGFCQQYDHQGADIVSVTPEQTADLGSCALIVDRYEPATSAGYLFAYDHEWIRNRDQFPHFNAGAAAVGDLNGDGLIDIVTSSVDAVSSTMGDLTFPEDFITVLINEGENSFVDARTSWVPGSYEGSGRDIEIADMDCDGHPDLILGTHGVEWSDGTPWGEQDMIWRNHDGQSFVDMTTDWMPLDDPSQYGQEQWLQAWFTHALEVGDLDGDGDLDIFRGTTEPVLLNDGSGKMAIAPPSRGFDGTLGQEWLCGGAGIDLADLNQDGHLDAFATGNGSNMERHIIALGNGDGTFRLVPGDEAPQVFESAVGYQPLLEDLNGDGLIDAYVANIHYIQNANPGELHQAADAPFDQLLLATGIVDGIPQYRDETGRIVQTHDFNKSWHASAGDLDNDGDLDVLVPNLSFGSDRYRSPEVRLLINDGSGAMAPLAELNFPPMIVSPTQILPFDSDLDGDLDLFLANGFTTPILLVNRLLETHDLTGDGHVRLDDAFAVLAAFGSRGQGQREDLNEDEVVDAKDLSLILRYQTTTRADNSNLGATCSKGLEVASP